MLFNSYVFILLFFPLVVVGYFMLNRISITIQKVWLILMSFAFYSYMNWKSAVLFIVGSLINYAIVKLMNDRKNAGKRKLWMILGVVFNVGVLSIYKYYDFFVSGINEIFGVEKTFTHLVMPLGISFITFQQISFIVDCYREQEIKCGLLDYAFYISFFPKIVSGPIVCYQDFMAQIKEEIFSANIDNLSKGIYGFARGLAKKVLIADVLAKIVSAGFSEIQGLNTISAIILIVSYSLQLYFDFSGYSDMAVGLARIFGIELSVNFNSPYKAKSVTDFWKRWHISLTQFFTKYIYIPLGGNRGTLTKTCFNIMIIYLISGLWHGDNWTFLLWGGLHGLFMVIERVLNKKFNWKHGIGAIGTFVFVNIAWLLFKAEDLNTVGLVLRQIGDFSVETGLGTISTVMNELTEVRLLCRFGLQGIVDSCPDLPTILFVGVVLLFTFLGKNTQEKVAAFAYNRKQMFFTVVLMVWSIVSLTNVSEFLYVNF